MAAFTTEFRNTTVKFLRFYIGDQDNLMFKTDDELDVFLRARVWPSVFTQLITAYKNHYYAPDPGCVLDLTITKGTAGAFYRVDESSKHVQWVSGSGQPSDNDTIEISYVRVDWNGTLTDVLTAIATDRVKLAVKAKAEGMENDLTGLAKSIMDQVAALGAVNYWSH